MLRKFLAAACFALAFAAAPSHAQPVRILPTCGTISPAFAANSQSAILTMDVNGLLCTAASVSASITGFPTVQSTGTPISVTTSSATGTLPSGAVVVASNVGATNGAYCKLGATATVNDQLIPPNSWFAFTVGANSQLSCITSTSTTTVNMVGGSGLPTGSGGGGGGAGGSSAITTWAGSTLGAISNYGTPPGAVIVPAFNAFITNVPAVSQSGTWTMQPGNTANTTPWLQTISQGGNSAIVKAGNTFAASDVALGVSVVNTNANGQAAMAASSPVVIASNQTANALWGHGVTGAAVPANATYFGFNSGGNLTGPSSAAPLPVRSGDGTRNAVLDPCEANTQLYLPISITSATTTRIVTPSASNKTYICGLIIVTGAANNVGIVEGTGGTCGTGTAGVIGGTTAANGPNFAANGGIALQAGKTAHAYTAGTNVDLCAITSSAGPYAGGIKYVQVP